MMKISIAKIILLICCLSAAIFPENCPVNVFAEQTDTIRYEAEDATLTDCVRSESVAYQNASGQAGVESIDYSTSRVEFQITVEETAKYLLTVGYCTANANATLVATTAENFTYLISCSQQTSWSGFGETAPAETEIDLQAGQQILSVRKGANFVRMDYIELVKIGEYEGQESPVPDGYRRYEAENLIKTGSGVSSANTTTASGKLFIGGISFTTGLTLDYTAEEGRGWYEFRIGYSLAMGASATLDIRKNGATAAEPVCSNGAGEFYFGNNITASAYIWLEENEEAEIGFYTKMSGPRFDFVDVRKLTEEEAAPASLAIDTTGMDLNVYADKPFSSEGLKVRVQYAGEIGTRILTADEYEVIAPENYDGMVAGEYSFKVALKGNEEVFAFFVVTVHEGEEALPQSLQIDLSGVNTNIPLGTEFSSDGIAVTMIRQDGTSVLLSPGEYTVAPKETDYNQRAGSHMFVVTYREISAEFEIVVVTRYEAEDAEIGGSASPRVKQSETASGGEYVGSIDNVGDYVRFTVTVEEDGEYQLNLCYANAAYARFYIDNDEGVYTRVLLHAKIGYGNFPSVASTKISLRAGENTIRIYKAEQSSYAELDYIEIGLKTGEYKYFDGKFTIEEKGETPNLLAGYVRYEAEKALVAGCKCYGFAYVDDLAVWRGYSGQGFVGGLDNDERYIEFTVSVEEDGEYAIRIGYAVRGAASLKVYAGQYGSTPEYLYATPGCVYAVEDWGIFTENAIAETTVCLKAGINYIRLRKGSASVQVDYLDLGERVGEYFEGAIEGASLIDKEEDDGYRVLSDGLAPWQIALICVASAVVAGAVVVTVVVLKRRKGGRKSA